jgi:hypothetical protein
MTTASPPTKKLFLNGVFDVERQRWQRLLHRSGREISAKRWKLPQLLSLKGSTKRLFLAVLAATSFVTCVHAQSKASGPLATVSGELQFVRDDRDFVRVLKSEVQHPNSYKVLRWKNDINSSSLKSG